MVCKQCAALSSVCSSPLFSSTSSTDLLKALKFTMGYTSAQVRHGDGSVRVNVDADGALKLGPRLLIGPCVVCLMILSPSFLFYVLMLHACDGLCMHTLFRSSSAANPANTEPAMYAFESMLLMQRLLHYCCTACRTGRPCWFCTATTLSQSRS